MTIICFLLLAAFSSNKGNLEEEKKIHLTRYLLSTTAL